MSSILVLKLVRRVLFVNDRFVSYLCLLISSFSSTSSFGPLIPHPTALYSRLQVYDTEINTHDNRLLQERIRYILQQYTIYTQTNNIFDLLFIIYVFIL